MAGVATRRESKIATGREAKGERAANEERQDAPIGGSNSIGHYGQTKGREREAEWARVPGGAAAGAGGVKWSALSRPLETRRNWALLYSEVRGE